MLCIRGGGHKTCPSAPGGQEQEQEKETFHIVHVEVTPVSVTSLSFFFLFVLFQKKKRSLRGRAYHHFVVAVAHVDGVLGWHHVPQSVAAQDDVAVALGVEGHHCGVGLGRNYKLAAVKVVAPQIALE